MKLLLDIKDNKADFFMEVLKNFSFVKTEKISPNKIQLTKDLKESVDYINLVKQGKAKARDIKDLLNEI